MKMYKEMKGYVEKGRLDVYIPPTEESIRWKQWWTILDIKTCPDCVNMHGKIWAYEDIPETEPPLHWGCRCVIDAMKAVRSGKGTKDDENGADWYLKYVGRLPDYYISEEDISLLGWRNGKSPVKYASGKMITRGKYENDDGHLPDVPGREWYEADINYYSGKRNSHRVLWSNDGLIFVTYDHYRTFLEIV